MSLEKQSQMMKRETSDEKREARTALGNAKSSARLLCPPERFHEFSGWDTAYVRDTVVVLSPDAGTTALGSAFGTREQINAWAWESVRACDEIAHCCQRCGPRTH